MITSLCHWRTAIRILSWDRSARECFCIHKCFFPQLFSMEILHTYNVPLGALYFRCFESLTLLKEYLWLKRNQVKCRKLMISIFLFPFNQSNKLRHIWDTYGTSYITMSDQPLNLNWLSGDLKALKKEKRVTVFSKNVKLLLRATAYFYRHIIPRIFSKSFAFKYSI